MNVSLTLKALAAITDDDFESAPGWCERFVSQVIRAVYGDKYDSHCLDSAYDSGLSWQAAGFAVDDDTPQIGDILVRDKDESGKFGHIALYTGACDHGPDCVTSNSSTPIGRISGAKGHRTLAEFGDYWLTVRLPDPAAMVVTLPDGQALPAWTDGSTAWVQATSLGAAFALPVGWNSGTASVGSYSTDAPLMVDGHAWVPVRAACEAAGLTLTAVGQGIAVSRSGGPQAPMGG